MNYTDIITGTFVQIDHWSDMEGKFFQEDLRKFNSDDWCETIDDMADIGIDTLIFQQCVDNRTGTDDTRAYYPSKTRKRPDWMKEDLFSAVVNHATEKGMTIIYGIDSMYGKDPFTCLDENLEQARITASELLELYGDLKSFGGWYWTREYPPCCDAGRRSLQKIVPEIRKLRDCNIMIAPNLDRPMVPAILDDIDVDIVAYQDNVGWGPFNYRRERFCQADSLNYLSFAYELMRFYHDGWSTTPNPWNSYSRPRGRVALWNDLEIWDYTRDSAIIPTEISRICSQLERTAPYVDKQIIYQYTGLMQNPERKHRAGGLHAEILYDEYKAYYDAVKAEDPTLRHPAYYRQYMQEKYRK